MKKIFNLAVIFAALMTAVSFSSCADEDKAADDAEEQALPQITVKEGGKYSFSNSTIGKSGYFKVTSVAGAAGSKVVKFEITTKKDDAKGTEYELGDDADHTSYLMYKDGTFSNVFQKDAEANAKYIVFCMSSEASSYVLTSATVNNKVKGAGATETLFAVVKE